MVSHSALAWFEDAAAQGSREFWQDRRDDYARDVRAPLLALLVAAGEAPDAWRVYRPHRDTRFAGPGANPLKDFLGALWVAPDGTGRYLQVDRRGLLASSGLPYLAADQLPRWREAVADARGDHLDEALRSAELAGARRKSGYPEPLKRVPRGWDADHPRADLLRWKGIEVYARSDVDVVDDVDDQAGWLRGVWAAGAPLCAWLAEHVGATALSRP